jgi:hypothetical protein
MLTAQPTNHRLQGGLKSQLTCFDAYDQLQKMVRSFCGFIDGD